MSDINDCNNCTYPEEYHQASNKISALKEENERLRKEYMLAVTDYQTQLSHYKGGVKVEGVYYGNAVLAARLMLRGDIDLEEGQRVKMLVMPMNTPCKVCFGSGFESSECQARYGDSVECSYCNGTGYSGRGTK
jgi:predicted amidophosphoribosyltransferase